MAEPWVLAPEGEVRSGRLRVEGEEAAHLVRVRRHGIGSPVVVIDGTGARGCGQIVEVERRAVVLEISSVELEPEPPGPGLTLAMSVLHGGAMDLAVQKAVELGAQYLRAVVPARAQLSSSDAERRSGHWHRVARQALKQCRRAHELVILPPCSLADLVSSRGERRGAVADPLGGGADALDDRATELLLVGPEGGFDETERRLLDDAAWPGLRLGPHVLRAETAAVAGLAVLGLERERRGRRRYTPAP